MVKSRRCTSSRGSARKAHLIGMPAVAINAIVAKSGHLDASRMTYPGTERSPVPCPIMPRAG